MNWLFETVLLIHRKSWRVRHARQLGRVTSHSLSSKVTGLWVVCSSTAIPCIVTQRSSSPVGRGVYVTIQKRLSSRLQSVALNLGHIALVPAFSFPVLFCNRFAVDLSKFEANIEEREKEVKHSMSTLFLLLTQVLMSQVIGSCPGEGHWVMLALEMSLPIWQKVTLEVNKVKFSQDSQYPPH